MLRGCLFGILGIFRILNPPNTHDVDDVLALTFKENIRLFRLQYIFFPIFILVEAFNVLFSKKLAQNTTS